MNKLIVILFAVSLFAVTEFQLSDVFAKPNKEGDVKVDPSDTKPKDKNGEDSAAKEDIPSVKISYGGQTYSMLPFVVVQDQDIHKLNFPQLPDDFKPVLQILQEEAFSLIFDSKPRETNAFIIDYDADITEISPVNNLGKNSFSIGGVHGPRTLEVRAIYPNDKYITYTLLVDVEETRSDSAIGSRAASTESIQSFGNHGKNGQEYVIDTFQNLRGKSADSVSERIQSEYGGIIEAANPLETDLIRPVTDISQTGSECMGLELPIGNVTTKNNSTSTDTAKVSNSNQESTPWIQIDLGSTELICGIKVQFKQGTDEVRFFTVELSTNGTSYTEPRYYSNSGSGSSGEIYNFDEEPVSARYIKLTELGKNGTDTG
jgi:hypothetical protein